MRKKKRLGSRGEKIIGTLPHRPTDRANTTAARTRACVRAHVCVCVVCAYNICVSAEHDFCARLSTLDARRSRDETTTSSRRRRQRRAPRTAIQPTARARRRQSARERKREKRRSTDGDRVSVTGKNNTTEREKYISGALGVGVIARQRLCVSARARDTVKGERAESGREREKRERVESARSPRDSVCCFSFYFRERGASPKPPSTAYTHNYAIEIARFRSSRTASSNSSSIVPVVTALPEERAKCAAATTKAASLGALHPRDRRLHVSSDCVCKAGPTHS